MEITSKQRAKLRGMAQNIETIAQFGKNELSPEQIVMVEQMLTKRELIKCSVLENSPYTARELANMLAEEGIDARVINIHTIKPLDKELILKAAAETGAIVTAEEHSVIGGLGAAVAETVCEACPVPVVRLGVNDEFGRSGTVPALLEMYGLTPANIAAKAKLALELKK